MILTGKTKDDFLEFNGCHEIYFKRNYSEVCQIAQIIEWFDSVGIYIMISVEFDTMGNYNRGFDASIYQERESTVNYVCKDNDVFFDRKEATEAAILKSNNLYNAKFG